MRTHLGEAFHLNQLNHDEIPDTPEELRTRNARIVQLCEWAEDLLDDRTQALAERHRARAPRARDPRAGAGGRRAPAQRLPHARDTARAPRRRATPRRRCGRSSEGADEAEQLLTFAAHSADVSARRREAGRREQANLALETATEAVRRAAAIIDGVEDFEIEALRAESTLADVIVEDSRGDLVAARQAPQVPAVTDRDRRARGGAAALPAARRQDRPVRRADAAARGQQRAGCRDRRRRGSARRARSPRSSTCATRIDDADRQLAVARNVIAGHRGWIGADARTRLAEAERIRIDLDRYLGTSARPRSRSTKTSASRRWRWPAASAFLASEALQLAQRDIDSSRPQGGPAWGGRQGWGGGRGGMSDAMGGILGGLVIGSLLGDFFD